MKQHDHKPPIGIYLYNVELKYSFYNIYIGIVYTYTIVSGVV